MLSLQILSAVDTFRRLAQSGESFLLSNNHFNATKIEPWPDSSFMISDAQL